MTINFCMNSVGLKKMRAGVGVNWILGRSSRNAYAVKNPRAGRSLFSS